MSTNPKLRVQPDANAVTARLRAHGVRGVALDEVRQMLADRDRQIEDYAVQGLRSTRSATAYGDGSSIGAVAPALVDVAAQVEVTYRKINRSSVLEVDAAVHGAWAVVAGIVVIGVDVRDPVGTVVIANQYVGSNGTGAPGNPLTIVGCGTLSGLGEDEYRVRLKIGVSAGAAFVLNADSLNSLRVTESVW